MVDLWGGYHIVIYIYMYTYLYTHNPDIIPIYQPIHDLFPQGGAP